MRPSLAVLAVMALVALGSVAVARTPPPPLPRVMPTGDDDNSGVSVYPIRLELSPQGPTGVLTVTNDSTAPAHFEVTAFSWDESTDGTTELTKSDDFVIYPTLFSVPAGGQQILRVGLQSSTPGSERAFRVFVEQLPEPQRAGRSTNVGLAIQTRLGIPVFYEPNNPTRAFELARAWIQGTKLSLHLRNTGSAYDVVTEIVATGRSAQGTQTFSARGAGWYVLAGHERTFALDVPRDACALTRDVRFTVTSEWSGGTAATLPLERCTK